MIPTKQRKDHASSGDIFRLAAQRLLSANASSPTGEGTRDIVGTEQVVKKIWHSVALVISDSLISFARGVRLESLGTFTLDAKGRPTFFLAHEFAARHRLLRYNACAGGCLAGGSINTRLNITRVAATAGRSRPETESVIDAVLRSLHQRLNKGKSSLTLSFHPVAEFMCVPGDHARLRYLSTFRAKQKKAGTAATHAQVGVARTKSYSSPWAAVVSSAGAAAEGLLSRTSAPITSSGETKPTKRNKLRRPLTAAFGRRSKPEHETKRRPGSSHSDGGTIRTLHSANVNTARESYVTKDPVGTQQQAWVSPRSSTGQHNSDASHCLKPGSASFDDSPTARYIRKHHSSIGSLLKRDRNDNLDSTVKKRNPAEAGDRYGDCNREGQSVEHSTESGEVWLGDVLWRKTRAQVGEEGLRRLVETLKLMLVSGSGNSVRLSGQDFILILRDVGTKLTSAELARITNLLKRRPDGRLSVRALTVAMGTSCRQQLTSATEPRMCKTADEMCASLRRQSALSQDRAARVISSTRGSSTSSNVDYLGHRGVEPSSPCTEILQPLEEVSHERADSGQYPIRERGNCDDCAATVLSWSASSDTKVNRIASTRPTFDKVSIHRHSGSCLPLTSREYRHNGAEVGGGMKVKAVAESEAIAELADIVYDPPCSLERLIHILQANKIAEHPTITCAALSSRLLQLRPGLGKARAKEIAAAPCRYPDAKIDLGRLHSLLTRRFGCSKSRLASSRTMQRGSITSSSVASEAAAEASYGILSCAAIDRVRRNLLSGGGTLRGLDTALSSASGCGDGTLTKDELRRALTMASGREHLPPTAKDVDDLFTLFSCRTFAGIGGDKVEELAVIRGLRGELSPRRERVVRDVFRALLRLNDGGGGGKGTIMNGGQRTGPRERVIPAGRLKQAACGGEASENTVRLMLSSVDKGNRGRRGENTKNAVSVEEFLEYYRDLSICIDGDDAFEAVVRGSWAVGAPGQAWQGDDTLTAESVSQSGDQAVEPAPPTVSPPIAIIVKGTEAPVENTRDTAKASRKTSAATGAGLPTTNESSQDQDLVDCEGSFDGFRFPLASTQNMVKSRAISTTAAAVKCIQSPYTTPTSAKQPPIADRGTTLKGTNDKEKPIICAVDTAFGLRPKNMTQATRGTRAKAASTVESTLDPRSSAAPTRHYCNVDQDRGAIPSAEDHSRPPPRAATACRDQPHAKRSRPKTSERRPDSCPLSHGRCFTAVSRSVRGKEGGEGSHRSMARRAGATAPSSRGTAALNVQRMFRGHKGRRSAAAEMRKLKRKESAELEERTMRERQAAASWQLGARLPRPKMPGTYGF